MTFLSNGNFSNVITIVIMIISFIATVVSVLLFFLFCYDNTVVVSFCNHDRQTLLSVSPLLVILQLS